jgi:Ca2+-binding RTX toxin-like protein
MLKEEKMLTNNIKHIENTHRGDFVISSDTHDVIYGSDESDVIVDDRSNNIISGNKGDDAWLDGGDGNDIIEGDSGNDKLSGGNGNDWMHGHEGDKSWWLDANGNYHYRGPVDYTGAGFVKDANSDDNSKTDNDYLTWQGQ